MPLPVVNVNETEKLIRAMENGSPFYIANSDKKLLVYDPNLKKAAEEITKALDRAEDCKERITESEFWQGV